MKYDIRKLMGLVDDEYTIPNIAIEPESAQRAKDRVMSQIRSKPRRRPLRIALTALAAVLALMVTAMAAEAAFNGGFVHIFNTESDFGDAYAEDHPTDTGYALAAPGSAAYNREHMETVAESVEWNMNRELTDEESLVSDVTGTEQDSWTRKRVIETTYCYYDGGIVHSEYTTDPAFSSRILIDGLLDWDISAIALHCTADEDAQLTLVDRDPVTSEIVYAHTQLGFTTLDGEPLYFNLHYDPYSPVQNENNLSTEYDFSELYITCDNVEVLLKGYDGQLWATARCENGSLSLFCFDMDIMEMKSLLDDLGLAVAMKAFG